MHLVLEPEDAENNKLRPAGLCAHAKLVVPPWERSGAGLVRIAVVPRTGTFFHQGKASIHSHTAGTIDHCSSALPTRVYGMHKKRYPGASTWLLHAVYPSSPVSRTAG